MKIGFVGLGVMGMPIACRMTAAGYEIFAHDTAPRAREIGRGRTVTFLDSLDDLGARSDVVFMMLPNVAAARSVTNALIDTMNPGSTLVELGTIGRKNAMELSQLAAIKGIHYVDAPVINGGAPAAAEGRLNVVAGGRAEDIELITPLLRTFSTRTFHLGTVGAGQSFKLAHNMLFAVITCATAETLAMLEKAGVEAGSAFEVMGSSSVRSFALDWLFPPALTGDYSGGAKVDIIRKDISLAIEDFSLTGVSPNFGVLVNKLYDDCVEGGWGNMDMAIVLELFRQEVGTVEGSHSADI